MKILFDQGTPVPLRKYLPSETIDTVYEKGWHTLQNGDLLLKAEQERYDVLVTTDGNLSYQQNLSGRKIGILVILSTSWPKIEKKVEEIQAILKRIQPGQYIEVKI